MKRIPFGGMAIAAIAALASPAIALTSEPSTSSRQGSSLQQNGTSEPVLLAAVQNNCQADESVWAEAETADYWVSICGGDMPHTYVGVSKRSGNTIRVPLDNYEEDGTLFEAINGDVSYLLIRNTARGAFLTVTQGERELFRQPVLHWDPFW